MCTIQQNSKTFNDSFKVHEVNTFKITAVFLLPLDTQALTLTHSNDFRYCPVSWDTLDRKKANGCGPAGSVMLVDFFFSLPIPLSVLHDAHQPTGTTETGCVVYLGDLEDGWV